MHCFENGNTKVSLFWINNLNINKYNRMMIDIKNVVYGKMHVRSIWAVPRPPWDHTRHSATNIHVF